MEIFRKYILTGVLLVAVLWLFYNAAVNWHYHITPCGQLTVHAHMYDKNVTGSENSPIEKHKHTDFEYKVLAQLFIITSLVFFAAVLLHVFRNKTAEYFNLSFAHCSIQSCISHLQLRAPPIL